MSVDDLLKLAQLRLNGRKQAPTRRACRTPRVLHLLPRRCGTRAGLHGRRIRNSKRDATEARLREMESKLIHGVDDLEKRNLELLEEARAVEDLLEERAVQWISCGL